MAGPTVPPSRQPPPPPEAALLIPAGAAAGTTGAAVGVGAAGAAAAAAALTAPLSAAAITSGVAATLSALDQWAARRLRTVHTAAVDAYMFARPARPALALRVADDELRREREYIDRARDRLSRDLTVALAIPNVAVRQQAVHQLVAREKRIVKAREQAIASRAWSAADFDAVRDRSPDGAVWRLGFARDHTPDCLALAGRAWPWWFLELMRPPRHHGCACHLQALQDAHAEGLLAAPVVPDDARELATAMVAEWGESGAALLNPPDERLREAHRWRPKDHPRDRRGRFIRKLAKSPMRRRTSRALAPPRRFDTFAEADLWGQRHYADWARSLTPIEREALAEYKGSGHDWINSYLRDDWPLTDHEYDLIDALDSALEKASSPEMVLVYRGLEADRWDDLMGAEPGDVVVDPGFMSTSLLETTAGSFATPPRLLLYVHVPAGAPVAYLEAAVPRLRELEMLIARSARFTVLSKHEQGDHTQIHLALVGVGSG